MKRLLSIIILITALWSCSKDEEQTPVLSTEEQEILNVLSGKFVGSLYSPTTSTTETEEITFTPYASAKGITKLLGEKIELYVYGTAIVTEYFNDHLLEVSQNCYYTVSVAYKGAKPTLSFYPYSDGGEILAKEDKRDITILSENSFKMCRTGLSDNNAKTFTKQ